MAFVQTSNKSSLEVLRQALREEGPKFLLKGWTPAFIRLGPNTVLLFVFFEVHCLVYLRTQVATNKAM